MSFWGSLLDLVYPRVCVACGAPDPLEERHLCWDCLSRCAFIQPPFCSRCGDPVPGRVDRGYRCRWCSQHAIHFEQARSAARYDGPAGEAVRALKYRGATWVARDLAGWLFAAASAHYPGVAFDAVCHVPLYPARRRRRQYNQAELLARPLARLLGVPAAPRGLRRVRPTPTQTRLTASARAANVRGAFKVRAGPWWTDRRLLLVDDVMTTGATVNECARALRAAGAGQVYVLTVARG